MTAAATATHEVRNGTSTIDRSSHADRPGVLSFPPFRLDLVEERLWNGNREARLRRKPFAILRFLAQNPRRLVTKGEIVDAVWGRNVAMSESLLRTHMRDLRHALGEAVIETVVGRGYRFVANVSCAEDAGSGRRLEGADMMGAMTSIGLGKADLAGARHLEIVRRTEPGRSDEDHEVTRPTVSAAHARVVKQLAEALAAAGTTATVVLILADAPSDADGIAATA